MATVAALALLAFTACSPDEPGAANATPTPSAVPSTATATPTATPTATSSVESITVGDRPATRTEVFGGPDWLAADESFVYVKRDSAEVDRLDPETGAVVASIELGGPVCQGLGAGFGSLWACVDTGLARIDFDSGEVTEIDVDKAPGQGQIATGMDRVWVLVGDGSSLVGIDPSTNQAGPPLALGVRGSELAVGAGRVWVVSATTDTIIEVDRTGTTVLRTITGVDEPRAVGATDTAVWVGGLAETVRIDPATGAVIARVPGGPGRFGSVHATDDGVWVRSEDRFLELIDPATNAEIEELPYGDVASGGHVIVAHGAVWASAYDDAAVIRVPLD
jgi:hypothetical protein